MAKFKRTLLFGYSKSSVDSAWNEQQREYDNRIRQLEQSNTTLQQQLESYQEKEQSISDALTEAKRMAQMIISDAQLKAEKLVKITEEGLMERVQHTEQKLKQLEETRQAIVNHEEFMKVEMKQLLNRQLEMINRISNAEFKENEQEVEKLLNEGREELETTRQNALGKTSVATKTPTLTMEDDIPVFSF